jgi:hypothetical protein
MGRKAGSLLAWRGFLFRVCVGGTVGYTPVIGGGFDLWDSHTIKVCELLDRIVEALHDDALRQQAALINLREEAQRWSSDGSLVVRNGLSMEKLSAPSGDQLWRGVLFPRDAQRFAEEHGVSVTIRPHGSGPTHWTLESAAHEIGKLHGWHQGATASLAAQMVTAAQRGELRVRHPHTDVRIPLGSESLTNVRDYYELVTHEDVNEWLANERAGYLWESGFEAAKGDSPSAGPGGPAGASQTAPSNASPPLVTATDLAAALDGCRWTGTKDGRASAWERRLSDPPKWMKASRKQRGAPGKAPSLWDPVELASALVGKGVSVDSLTARFARHLCLRQWAARWNERAEVDSDYGLGESQSTQRDR